DADNLAVDRSVVIAPGGAFAPGSVVTDTLAVDDMPLGRPAFGPFQTHRLGQAHGHGPFFGITKGHGPICRSDSNVEVEQPLVSSVVKPHRPFIGADHFAISPDQRVEGLKHSLLLAGFDLLELLVDGLTGLVALRPEVLAINLAMGIPERTVMRVI